MRKMSACARSPKFSHESALGFPGAFHLGRPAVHTPDLFRSRFSSRSWRSRRGLLRRRGSSQGPAWCYRRKWIRHHCQNVHGRVMKCCSVFLRLSQRQEGVFDDLLVIIVPGGRRHERRNGIQFFDVALVEVVGADDEIRIERGNRFGRDRSRVGRDQSIIEFLPPRRNSASKYRVGRRLPRAGRRRSRRQRTTEDR